MQEEVNQRGSDLSKWLRDNPQVVTRMLPEESREYMRLIVQSNPAIDDGEAVAIAIASQRKLALVIEDGAGRIVAARAGLEVLSVRPVVNDDGFNIASAIWSEEPCGSGTVR